MLEIIERDEGWKLLKQFHNKWTLVSPAGWSGDSRISRFEDLEIYGKISKQFHSNDDPEACLPFIAEIFRAVFSHRTSTNELQPATQANTAIGR